eukprot:1157435-Pelagomonas_calceolata.AAC.8
MNVSHKTGFKSNQDDSLEYWQKPHDMKKNYHARSRLLSASEELKGEKNLVEAGSTWLVRRH